MADHAQPRAAADIPEWAPEEIVRDAVVQTMRSDIADRALAWLTYRLLEAT
jgi:hypothetical protein